MRFPTSNHWRWQWRFFVAGLGLCSLLAAKMCGAVEWAPLAQGLDLGGFTTTRLSPFGHSKVTVLRADPAHWALALATSEQLVDNKSARQWSKQNNFVAVINAGMFATDMTTHIGYMRDGGKVYNGNVNQYRSLAAFGPRHPHLPRFRIFDLDAVGISVDALAKDYQVLIQNLRLIKRPGDNRWTRQDQIWSEAALGEDRLGRILFIFSPSPFSMSDLNRELLAQDIDLLCAQHLEGGPEAQLYIRHGEVEMELLGNYETDLADGTQPVIAWPVPNVLGLRPRSPEQQVTP